MKNWFLCAAQELSPGCAGKSRDFAVANSAWNC